MSYVDSIVLEEYDKAFRSHYSIFMNMEQAKEYALDHAKYSDFYTAINVLKAQIEPLFNKIGKYHNKDGVPLLKNDSGGVCKYYCYILDGTNKTLQSYMYDVLKIYFGENKIRKLLLEATPSVFAELFKQHWDGKETIEIENQLKYHCYAVKIPKIVLKYDKNGNYNTYFLFKDRSGKKRASSINCTLLMYDENGNIILEG